MTATEHFHEIQVNGHYKYAFNFEKTLLIVSTNLQSLSFCLIKFFQNEKPIWSVHCTVFNAPKPIDYTVYILNDNIPWIVT